MGEDRPQTSRQRVAVAQAAEILGVTVEAIRGRIKRGTLDHERHSGKVYVLLDADQSTNRTRPDTNQTTDRLQSDSTALISAKDETIATLREQLEAERRAHAEARRIIAGLVERIPAIEAPSEARESPQTVEQEPERAEPHPDAPGAQEGVEHDASTLREWTGDVEARPRPDSPGAHESAQRPWWRRMFGS